MPIEPAGSERRDDTTIAPGLEEGLVLALRAQESGNWADLIAWMTRHPDTATQTATIGEAAAMMVHGGYRHVPIVDGDHAIGIVSIRDLLRLPSEAPSGV